MRGLNKPDAHADDLGALIRELPPFSPLPELSRFLGGALTVRQLRRRIRNRTLQAYRTSARGSGRLIVARGEVRRLLEEMRGL